MVITPFEQLGQFLQSHSLPATGFSTFLICNLTALCLGVGLSLIYRLYFLHHDAVDASLGRSLALITPALASIFLVVQTSLALSVGVLGSLAFVRFRTPVKRAEDVTFILFALGTALLCSVGHYPLAVILVAMLLVFSWGLNLVLRRYRFRPRYAVVTINTRKTERMDVVETVLNPVARKIQFVSSRTYDGITSFVVNVPHLGKEEHASLVQTLIEWDGAAHVNVFYPTESLAS